MAGLSYFVAQASRLCYDSVDLEEFAGVEQHAGQGGGTVALDERHDDALLGGRRCATESEAVGEPRLGGGIAAGFSHEALAEHPGLVQDEGVVEQRQRLQGRRGRGPAWGRRGGVGAVQRVEERVAPAPRPEAVERAAVEALADLLDRLVELRPLEEVRLEVEVRRAAEPRVEVAGDGEDGVAQGLRLEPARTLAPIKFFRAQEFF